MKNRHFWLWLFLLVSTSALAQFPPYFERLERKVPEKANKEFQYIAFFYNHYVNSNIYPTNDFLRGQVIGRLYGQNTTTTSDTLTSSYFEQRILPFFIYQPKLFDGRAILRASFEIDFTWGDVAYGTGGNFGGGPSADQVNLQTQNVEVELIPAPGWAVNIGLQRMYDTSHNPYRTFFDQMLHSAYRLNYWGTDGVGITLRRDADFYKLKAGFYQLYENSIQNDDDVHLLELNYRQALGRKWHWGGSAYYVRDRSNGQGGPSILGQGLNSTLNDYNGTFRFRFGSSEYRADVAWLGTYFGYNENQMMDHWTLTGYLNYNLGATQLKANDIWEDGPTIGGLGANLRAAYRYGKTPDDAISVDLIYTTGDDNGITDDKYSGVMTGNTWGTPAGLHVSHGAYLLFPHANVVNRYVAAVTDLSNLGYGLTAGTINLSRDFIPYKLSGKIGAAAALSNAEPLKGGQVIGLESNLKLGYQIGVFMQLELHAAYLWLGDFYDSPLVNGGAAERPANPYTALMVLKWLMF
ncbi:MAG: hypothetical protein H6559_32715 [Lewinellaceae bacterium]|nr:hypothetical protein [Lewinellaceae bacterium]